MRRGRFLKNAIPILCLVISVCCLLVVFTTMLSLPEASSGNNGLKSLSSRKIQKLSQSKDFGVFGEMMIGMLPQDLPFTVFVPSEKAFNRDLRLTANDSLSTENVNNTYAIVSRVLGFSAVPRILSSVTVPIGRELSYDSLSGFILHISMDDGGMFVVNKVRSEQVDIRRGEIVVHVMDGVIMDADFEQSVQPDYDE